MTQRYKYTHSTCLVGSLCLEREAGVLEEGADDPGGDSSGQVAPAKYVAQDLQAEAAAKITRT